jgi:3-oxoacyl-[acyl-carrier protein] reductase
VGGDEDNLLDLTGRVALVTGGSRGIGRAAALGFARAGARVAVTYNTRQAEALETVAAIRADGGDALAVRADVSDAAAVDALMQAVDEFAGSMGLGILFNNAGIYPVRPFEEIEPDLWDKVIAVNVRGPYLCVRAALPLLRRAGRARIINIASGTVFLAPPGLTHYITAKAAILGFTRALARELGNEGINVNCVIPSLVQTESSEHWFPGADGPAVEMQAIHRRQQPEDMVALLVFLASERSTFITGQTINVDGGLVLR